MSHPICDACETVSWCYKKGCIPSLPVAAPEKSVEQRIRDALERMEVDGAQNFSAGELGELANMVRGIGSGANYSVPTEEA